MIAGQSLIRRMIGRLLERPRTSATSHATSLKAGFARAASANSVAASAASSRCLAYPQSFIAEALRHR